MVRNPFLGVVQMLGPSLYTIVRTSGSVMQGDLDFNDGNPSQSDQTTQRNGVCYSESMKGGGFQSTTSTLTEWWSIGGGGGKTKSKWEA